MASDRGISITSDMGIVEFEISDEPAFWSAFSFLVVAVSIFRPAQKILTALWWECFISPRGGLVSLVYLYVRP